MLFSFISNKNLNLSGHFPILLSKRLFPRVTHNRDMCVIGEIFIIGHLAEEYLSNSIKKKYGGDKLICFSSLLSVSMGQTLTPCYLLFLVPEATGVLKYRFRSFLMHGLHTDWLRADLIAAITLMLPLINDTVKKWIERALTEQINIIVQL